MFTDVKNTAMLNVGEKIRRKFYVYKVLLAHPHPLPCRQWRNNLSVYWVKDNKGGGVAEVALALFYVVFLMIMS